MRHAGFADSSVVNFSHCCRWRCCSWTAACNKNWYRRGGDAARCVLANAQNVSHRAAASRATRLDLRAPDIRRLLTPEQIAAAIGRARDENIEEVEVEGTRTRPPPATPEVWGGLATPVWALFHPTQAWRIFAPLPPDRAYAAAPPGADSSQREPATGIPRMAGE